MINQSQEIYIRLNYRLQIVLWKKNCNMLYKPLNGTNNNQRLGCQFCFCVRETAMWIAY